VRFYAVTYRAGQPFKTIVHCARRNTQTLPQRSVAGPQAGASSIQVETCSLYRAQQTFS
jgi:hypothetical protein